MIIERLFTRIETNTKETRALATQRDALVPGLVLGMERIIAKSPDTNMTIDDQIRILERFNEKVDRLNHRGFAEESRGGGAIVEWHKGLGWDGIHIGPSEKTVEATALTLRFFTVNSERTSLLNMTKLYSSLNIDPQFSTQFCEIRDQVNSYLDTPSNLAISEDGPMTRREILNLFINGDLAHANNTATEANYRSIRQTAFFPLFQDEFTKTVQLFMSALNEIQQINCVALNQLRRVGTPP